MEIKDIVYEHFKKYREDKKKKTSKLMDFLNLTVIDEDPLALPLEEQYSELYNFIYKNKDIYDFLDSEDIRVLDEQLKLIQKNIPHFTEVGSEKYIKKKEREEKEMEKNRLRKKTLKQFKKDATKEEKTKYFKFKVPEYEGDSDFYLKYLNKNCLRRQKFEYIIQDYLSRGRYGYVYTACTSGLENDSCDYVIKLTEDFALEFELGKKAGDNNIGPKYYQAWKCDNILRDLDYPVGIIVMEKLNGKTIGDLNNIKFSLRSEIITKIMRLMQKLHDLGIVHNDVHLDNVFMLKNGDLKIIDYGLARKIKNGEKKTLSEHSKEQNSSKLLVSKLIKYMPELGKIKMTSDEFHDWENLFNKLDLKNDTEIAIKGPISLVELKKGDKHIYIFGDFHKKLKDCDGLLITDFLDEQIRLNPDKTIDIFLEEGFREEKVNREEENYIDSVMDMFSDCMRHRGCEYKNVRAHYVDVRKYDKNSGLYTIEKIIDLFLHISGMKSYFKNMIENMEELEEKKHVSIDREFKKELEKMSKDVKEILTNKGKYQSSEDVYQEMLDSYFKTKVGKQLENIVEYKDQIIKFHNDCINKRELENVLSGISFHSIIEDIDVLLELILTKEYKNVLKGSMMYFSIINTNIWMDIAIILIRFGSCFMDTYLLSRMFRKFKDGTKPENVIIYAGDEHANTYKNFLVSVGFKVEFQQVNEFNNNKVKQCIDVSELNLPLFQR